MPGLFYIFWPGAVEFIISRKKIFFFQEFIEKAKGIVSNHHELQRNKATIETEVRQLELEQEKIIQTKEKEMIDHLLKQGMTVGDAKRRVKLTIENTINALQGNNKFQFHEKKTLFSKLFIISRKVIILIF